MMLAEDRAGQAGDGRYFSIKVTTKDRFCRLSAGGSSSSSRG